MKNVIICSLYANPLSFHHLTYLEASKNFDNNYDNNTLVVIINSDIQVSLKNNIPFLDENTRLRIVQSLKFVDITILSKDEDTSVSKTINYIYNSYNEGQNWYFMNGGPLIFNDKENKTCELLGIKRRYGVGGDKKIESSSWIIERAAKEWCRRKLDL